MLDVMALATLLLLPAPALAESVDAAKVPGWRRVEPALAVSGQPAADGWAIVAAAGVRTVIGLRPPEEHAGNEQAALAAGLRFVAVPVSPASFSAGDVARVKAVLEDPASGPVLLQCSSGNRSAGVWAAVQAARGVPAEEALAAARAAGLRSGPMEDAVRRVLPQVARP